MSSSDPMWANYDDIGLCKASVLVQILTLRVPLYQSIYTELILKRWKTGGMGPICLHVISANNSVKCIYLCMYLSFLI